MREILRALADFPGKVSFYYRPLDGSAAVCYNADAPLVAASVIKIPVMVEAFSRIHAGTLARDALIRAKAEDKMPSCGVITYLRDGLPLSVADLITLMIIVSDNTATNLLIDRLGMERINQTMRDMGIPGVWLERKLFDAAEEARGRDNRITARGIGLLLEKMFFGEVVSPEISREMLNIMKNQQLNGKFPFYLSGVEIAHKTGEDGGITHDAGIIYARRPFVLCMFSNEVAVPAFERLMQDAARRLYQANA